MPSGKVAYLTADTQTNISILRGIIFTSATAGETMDLKAGSSSGAVVASFIVPANGSIVLNISEGLPCPTGQFYADVTGAGTKVTLIGD